MLAQQSLTDKALADAAQVRATIRQIPSATGFGEIMEE